MKTKGIIAIAATLCMCFSTLALLAQAGPPPSPGAGGPIDGGISILLIGAAAMGYKKMRKKEEAKEND